MRRILVSLACVVSAVGFSQETLPQNEFKLNIGYSLLGFPEVSYERILGEQSAVGLSAAFAIESDIDEKFSFIPYYRLYFGKARAAGFFLEANAAFWSIKDDEDDGATNAGGGVGFAIGGKWVTKSQWSVELVAGAGRNLINSNQVRDVYPRLGVTIGKRF